MCDIIVDDSRWDRYRTVIASDLAQLREDLAPLEAGELHVAERLAGGPWVDVTCGMIASHKRIIATFEELLLALQGQAHP